MSKKGRRAKSKNSNLDISIIITIVLSVLAVVLIYSKSGYIGRGLSDFCGGIDGGGVGMSLG